MSFEDLFRVQSPIRCRSSVIAAALCFALAGISCAADESVSENPAVTPVEAAPPNAGLLEAPLGTAAAMPGDMAATAVPEIAGEPLAPAESISDADSNADTDLDSDSDTEANSDSESELQE